MYRTVTSLPAYFGQSCHVCYLFTRILRTVLSRLLPLYPHTSDSPVTSVTSLPAYFGQSCHVCYLFTHILRIVLSRLLRLYPHTSDSPVTSVTSLPAYFGQSCLFMAGILQVMRYIHKIIAWRCVSLVELAPVGF